MTVYRKALRVPSSALVRKLGRVGGVVRKSAASWGPPRASLARRMELQVHRGIDAARGNLWNPHHPRALLLVA